MLCMRWVTGQGGTDCQVNVTKHLWCWQELPHQGSYSWGCFGEGTSEGTPVTGQWLLSESFLFRVCLPVQLWLWSLGLLLLRSSLCIAGVQMLCWITFPVLYLTWDGRSTLVLQHLPKHGTELEWLLWESLSRSREAVLSWLLGRAPLSQMFRFSEGAGCVGSYPLSFPAWLQKGIRDCPQVWSLPPSLMPLQKSVLLYGTDPTDCLEGGNPCRKKQILTFNASISLGINLSFPLDSLEGNERHLHVMKSPSVLLRAVGWADHPSMSWGWVCWLTVPWQTESFHQVPTPSTNTIIETCGSLGMLWFPAEYLRDLESDGISCMEE